MPVASKFMRYVKCVGIVNIFNTYVYYSPPTKLESVDDCSPATGPGEPSQQEPVIVESVVQPTERLAM